MTLPRAAFHPRVRGAMSSRTLTSVLLVLVLGVALAPPTAYAVTQAPLVSMGEIVVQLETPGARELTGELRKALADELAALARSSAGGGRAVVVSATLTKLATERRGERTRATANISLALRRADDHVLFAELRGRASVEEATGSPAALQRAALRGAMRGALARLAEAVQRSG